MPSSARLDKAVCRKFSSQDMAKNWGMDPGTIVDEEKVILKSFVIISQDQFHNNIAF